MNGSRGSQRKTLSERTWAIALQITRVIPPGADFAALMIARQHGEIWRVPQNTGQLSFGFDGGTGLIGQLPHTLQCSPSSAGHPRQTAVAGEKEVLECNPQRVCRIKKEAGWESVFFGTLNLRVADGVCDGLSAMHELFFERPEDVRHPTNHRIPRMRGGYYYYRATASARSGTQEVLVRRAGNPHDEAGVELKISSVLSESG